MRHMPASVLVTHLPPKANSGLVPTFAAMQSSNGIASRSMLPGSAEVGGPSHE